MLRAIIYSIICCVMAVAGSIAHGANMPIVLVHGIMAVSKDMNPLKVHIEEALPGTYVKCVDLGKDKWSSLHNMHDQGKYLCAELQKDSRLNDGFIMICHSQGGLVGRYYVERFNNPKVHTYISLGSPQRGCFGLPGTYDNRFKVLNVFENLARFIVYRRFMQNHFSFCQYFCDSKHYDLYLRRCTFLPYLNNEIDHEFAAHYKANICSLSNMVLIESMCDTIIEPVDSCQFGFYKRGSKSVMEEIYFWDVYTKDTLGLKTLDDTGRLWFRWATCTHTQFQEDKQNFEQNILPFIKVQVVGQESPVIAANPS